MLTELFDRRGFHLAIQTVRFTVAGTLWAVTLFFTFLGLAQFTRVFTGDAAYGAVDGFQFVGAAFGAFWRIVFAAICGWGVWRTLRWDPGGRRAAASLARSSRPERRCPLLDQRHAAGRPSAPRCPLLDSVSSQRSGPLATAARS